MALATSPTNSTSPAASTPKSHQRPPHPIDGFVGRRIKLRREELGLSMEKLGEALGITFQQVQKYEWGTNRVSCSRLAEIAKTLKCEITYFFPPGGSAGDQTDVTRFADNVQALRLLRAFAAVTSDAAREHLLGLAEITAGIATTESPRPRRPCRA